jgi:hypothetical protein
MKKRKSEREVSMKLSETAVWLLIQLVHGLEKEVSRHGRPPVYTVHVMLTIPEQVEVRALLKTLERACRSPLKR